MQITCIYMTGCRMTQICIFCRAQNEKLNNLFCPKCCKKSFGMSNDQNLHFCGQKVPKAEEKNAQKFYISSCPKWPQKSFGVSNDPNLHNNKILSGIFLKNRKNLRILFSKVCGNAGWNTNMVIKYCNI